MNTVIEQINSMGSGFVEFAWPMLVQSSVLIAILLLADLLLRKKIRAVFRYCVWMLVLVKLVLPTTLSTPLSLGYWVGDHIASLQVASESVEAEPVAAAPVVDMLPIMKVRDFEASRYTPVAPPGMASTERAVTEPHPLVVETATAPVRWQGIVFLIWLAVVVMMGLLLLQRAMFVRGLVAQAKEANGTLAEALADCCRQMGLRKKIGLKISPNATSPAVCGLFRPVILLPGNLEPTLESRDLRAVLMHELAHIKRWDLFVNLVQTVLQIVYFYNPLLWVANAVIRRVREQAVDEMVLVAMGEKARQYPQTLVNVAKVAFRRPALSLRLIGVVESENALAGRIKHILNRPIPKSAKLGILGLLAIFIIAAILLPMARSAISSPGLVIKGIVKDARTGELIAEARVFDDGYGPTPAWDEIRPNERCEWGAITDSAGEYSFLTWPEHHTIKAQAPGYKAKTKSLYDGHFTINKKDQEVFDFALEADPRDPRLSKLTAKEILKSFMAAALSGAEDKVSQLVTSSMTAGKIKDFQKIKSVEDLKINRVYYAGGKYALAATSRVKISWARERIFFFRLERRDTGWWIYDMAFNKSGWRIYDMAFNKLGQYDRQIERFYTIYGDLPAENENPPSKLAFRVVPNIDSGRQPNLTRQQLEQYSRDLQANGPAAGNKEYRWMPAKQELKGDLPLSTYQGRQYILLCSQSPYVMMPGDGWALTKVYTALDNMGRPMVGIGFDRNGGELFYKLTKENLQNSLAIVIDDQVNSTPTIQTPVRAHAIITGSFSEREAEKTAIALQQGMSPGKSHLQPGTEKAPQSQFSTTLPNGVTVELLGVCEHPSEGKQWWRPDGSLLEEAPSENLRLGGFDTKESEAAYELVVKVKGPKQLENRSDSPDRWKVPQARKVGLGRSGKFKDKSGKPSLRATTAIVKRGLDSIDVTFGIGWQVKERISVSSGEKSKQRDDNIGIVVDPPYEKNGKPTVTIKIPNKTDEKMKVGVRAVLKDGSIRGNPAWSRNSKFRFMASVDNYEFAGIAFSEVDHFEIFTIDYQWVEFKDISLKPTGKAAVKVEAEKTSQPQFSKTLPNGVTVELVGVCDHPSEGKQWWRPDGSSIEADGFRDYDFDDAIVPEDNQFLRLLALRFDDDVLQNIRFSWVLKDARESRFEPDYTDKERKRLRPIQVIEAAFPKAVQSTNLQLGVATGPWESVAAGAPATRGAHTLDSITQGDVIYHEAREDNGYIHISATHLLGGDYDCRIVAKGKDGKVYEPSKYSNPGREMRLCKSEFDVPLEQVKWFYLQARPFQWLTFKNVSLKPNFKTDVQVEVADNWRKVTEQTSYARLVFDDEDKITFQGQYLDDINDLSAMLANLPEPQNTVLEWAFAPGTMPEPKSMAWLGIAYGLSDIEKLVDKYGLKSLVCAGEQPLGSRGGAFKGLFRGTFSLDKEIPVDLQSSDGFVKCQSIKFEKTKNELKASLQIALTSYPKTKWESRLELRDAGAEEILALYQTFENSGIIEGFPLVSDETIQFSQGKFADFSDIDSFELRVRQVQDKKTAVQIKTENNIQAPPLKDFERKLIEQVLDLVKQVEKQYPEQATHWPAGAGLYHIDAQGEVTVWHYRALWRRSTDCAPDEVGWGSSQLVNATGMYYLPDGTPLQSRWRERGDGMKDIRVKVGRTIDENERVAVIHRHSLPSNHDLLSRDGLERNILLDSWKGLPLAIIIRVDRPMRLDGWWLGDVETDSQHFNEYDQLIVNGPPGNNNKPMLVTVGLPETDVQVEVEKPHSTKAVAKQGRKVYLPDLYVSKKILDLASGKLVAYPLFGEPLEKVRKAIREKGKGDLFYARNALVFLRGSQSDQYETIKENGAPCKIYRIGESFPQTITVTTKEGRKYKVKILSADKKGCQLEYYQEGGRRSTGRKPHVEVETKSDRTIQAIPLKAFEFKLVEQVLDLVKQVEKKYQEQATHWPAGAGLYHIDAQGEVTVWHYRALWRRSTDCAPDEVGWGSSQLVNATGMYYLPDGTPLQSRWRERGDGMKDIRVKVGRTIDENERVAVIHRHSLPSNHDLLSRDGLERNILLDSWKGLPLAIIIRVDRPMRLDGWWLGDVETDSQHFNEYDQLIVNGPPGSNNKPMLVTVGLPETDVRLGIEETISPKLVMLLGAINSCAAETKLNIESISITAGKISIKGDTSSRTNTRKFLDAIKENELKILQLRLDARDNRDKFSIIVEPKKDWQKRWQQHKNDVHVGVEKAISPKLVMLLGAINSCAAETKLNIESISITAAKINIKGDISGRTNTQKFLDAIKKNELEILQLRLDTKDNHDKFSIIVEPKDNWQQHKTDVQVEAERLVGSKLMEDVHVIEGLMPTIKLALEGCLGKRPRLPRLLKKPGPGILKGIVRDTADTSYHRAYLFFVPVEIWPGKPVFYYLAVVNESFEITGIPAGSYYLFAIEARNSDSIDAVGLPIDWPRTVMVDAGGKVTRVEIEMATFLSKNARLWNAQGFLRGVGHLNAENVRTEKLGPYGKVSDAKGRPVPYATVQVREFKPNRGAGEGIAAPDARTNEQGYYGLRPLDYPYHVGAMIYEPLMDTTGYRWRYMGRNKVFEGKQAINFKFSPWPSVKNGSGTIEGIVVDDNNNLIPSFIVDVRPAEPWPKVSETSELWYERWGLRSAFSRGQFALSDVPEGICNVRIMSHETSAARGVTLGQREIVVPAGQTIHLEFQIEDWEKKRKQRTVIYLGRPPVGKQEPPEPLPELKVGDKAPLFEVETLGGKSWTLADHQGKVVLLNFWVAGSNPSENQLTYLKAVYEAFRADKRFVMLGLVRQKRKVADLQKYLAMFNARWDQTTLDGEDKTELASKYGVRSWPAAILIGPDGKVIARNLKGNAIKWAVEKALMQAQDEVGRSVSGKLIKALKDSDQWVGSTAAIHKTDVQVEGEGPGKSTNMEIQPLSFGPVVDCVVYAIDTEKDSFIDFDTGKFFNTPKKRWLLFDFDVRNLGHRVEWAKKTGADAAVRYSSGGRGLLVMLWSYGIAAKKVEPDDWQDLRAEQVVQYLSKAIHFVEDDLGHGDIRQETAGYYSYLQNSRGWSWYHPNCRVYQQSNGCKNPV